MHHPDDKQQDHDVFRWAARLAYGPGPLGYDLDALEAYGVTLHAYGATPLEAMAGALMVRVARLERERAAFMDSELKTLIDAERRELSGGSDG